MNGDQAIVPGGVAGVGVGGNVGGAGGFRRSQDDEFIACLSNMVGLMKKVPGRVNESGISSIAKNNKFEVFDEAIPDGKRITISGRIVLIDIDLKQCKIQSQAPLREVSKVKISLASSLAPTEERYSIIKSSAEEIILKALQETTLESFSGILEYLSLLDSLSAVSADCFGILDEISHAIFAIYGHGAQNDQEIGSLPYGVPELNPEGKLGLRLHYWTERSKVEGLVAKAKYYSWVSVRPIVKNEFITSSKYAVRYSKEWVTDPAEPAWSDPEPLESVNAELVVKLDPPVYVPLLYARQVEASILGEKSDFEARLNAPKATYKRVVQQGSNGDSYELQIWYGNTAPDTFVQIHEIPISHPKDAKEILEDLRRYIRLTTLLESLIGSQFVEQTQMHNDIMKDDKPLDESISFADAIAEYDAIQQENIVSHANYVSVSLVDDGERLSIRLEVNDKQVDLSLGQNGSINLVTNGQHEEKLSRIIDIVEDLGILSRLI